MLLKVVWHQETVPSEAIIEETDLGDQFCGMTQQMATNLKHEDKIDQPHKNISVLNQCTSQGFHNEFTLLAEGIIITTHGALDVKS